MLATKALGLVSLQNSERVGECGLDIQATDEEEERHDDLLLLGQLQAPEVGQRRGAQDEVGGDVDGRAGVEEIGKGEALCAFVVDAQIPCCRDGDALQDGCRHGCNEETHGHDRCDVHCYVQPVVGKDAQVGDDDGELGEGYGADVEDVAEEHELSWDVSM